MCAARSKDAVWYVQTCSGCSQPAKGNGITNVSARAGRSKVQGSVSYEAQQIHVRDTLSIFTSIIDWGVPVWQETSAKVDGGACQQGGSKSAEIECVDGIHNGFSKTLVIFMKIRARACVVILQQRKQCLMAAVLQLGYRFYIPQ